jgi:hypothetical protein
MRMRALLVLTGLTVVTGVVTAVVVYRTRDAGHAEVRDITERVAAAMAAGDREALAADPALHGHPETATWLAAQGPVLARGYRVSVQRNGDNGYQLLDLDVVSHVGRIETPAGTFSLGFRRDPDSGGLTFVTAASQVWVSGSGDAGGDIRVGERAAEPVRAPDRGGGE